MFGAIGDEALTLWLRMMEGWTRRSVEAVRRYQEVRQLRWRAGLASLALAVVVPVAARAEPGDAYRPEAETRFLDRCAEEGRTPPACRRMMENVQRRYGRALFVVFAPQGPRGFDNLGDFQPSARRYRVH
ncbi:hypothetical protein [Muricoccus radiodurans]|uniref:hypothetical protein n=1 Tax=Muricoccus radiodurans TaxID=2231721 RepID=UPI003CED1108